MGQKISIGPIPKGLVNNRTDFNIDDGSFPTLINAYQWRGRIKRKRGTSLLNRLTRYFKSTSTSYSSTATFALVAGAGNILVNAGWTLQVNGNIVPGSVIIVDVTAGNTYTDPLAAGVLTGAPGGTGTINYATGAITISGGAGNSVNATFLYYPNLPVMGLEDLILNVNQFPGTLGFNTRYSYNISTTYPYRVHDVSFYKNPSTGVPASYVQKADWTPTSWNGQDYQQFWTVNYQGALWATNGVNRPFSVTNIGMQFSPASDIIFVAATPTTLTVTIANCPLVIGDFVFLNEWTAPTPADEQTLNFQTGYVTACAPNTPALALKTVTITFPNAAIAAVVFVPGIIQYLTTRRDTTVDSLRWYDGDPTNGNAITPVLNGTKGWVNFTPPLSRDNYTIADLPAAKYYLVGAKMILNFKDRLLFIGPVVQTSSAGSQVYLKDTVIYSQNGTPYYTSSFTEDPSAATTVFHELLVPTNQTATANAYWEDQAGFGGFISAGVDEAINTASANGDTLILGFDQSQTRFVYTGNDIVPFNFYLVNSEYGSTSTFSAINLDRGVLSRGDRGFIISSQTNADRFDIEIPDEVFEIKLLENGTERFCSQRDFRSEWVYFTYPSNQFMHKFPTRTLQFNYKDDSWAMFNECYTTYGQFRKTTGFTWATVGDVYPTWDSWNDPWNAGTSTLLQADVIAGNQQGFVLVRDDGTNEGNSLTIQSFSGNQVTSPNHCLNNEDFITISGCLGTIGSQVNNKIFSVYNVTTDTFRLNPTISSGTYIGGGLIKRMYIPFVQTKQFPVAWEMARKTRLGVQQYLLTTTQNSQIQLLIFLSQNSDSPYNTLGIIPDISVDNGSLIYSTVLYTCPESANLGLTPANTNLNMVTAQSQEQIWHRINTSLLGDTVQLGFTLSEAQMRAVDDDGNPISQFSEIELHHIILDVSPSMVLA